VLFNGLLGVLFRLTASKPCQPVIHTGSKANCKLTTCNDNFFPGVGEGGNSGSFQAN